MVPSLIIIFFIIVSGVGGTAVLSADKAVPGDILYGLDRSMESLRLSMARTPEKKVQLQLEAAQERLQEAQVLAERGDADLLDTALTGFDEAFTTATLVPVKQDFKQVEAVTAMLDEAFPVEEPDEQDNPRCFDPAVSSHPTGARLATIYAVPYEEIMGWFCQGFGFGEIKIAYNISQETEYTVEDLFGMRDQGLGWGEIMQLAGLIGAPDELEDGEFEEGEGNENEGQETEDGEEQEAEDAGRCDFSTIHPKGQSLAADYGVTYEEIMDWFCQGYGFGEIKLAYNIAREKEIGVPEVFALRAGGMGWGEVMQEYELKGNPNKDKEEKEKGGGKPAGKPGGKPNK